MKLVRIYLDSTAPIMSGVFPETGYTTDANPIICSGIVSDTGSGINRVMWENSTNGSGGICTYNSDNNTWTEPIYLLENSTNEVKFWCYDRAGRKSDVITRNIVHDSSSPSLCDILNPSLPNKVSNGDFRYWDDGSNSPNDWITYEGSATKNSLLAYKKYSCYLEKEENKKEVYKLTSNSIQSTFASSTASSVMSEAIFSPIANLFFTSVILILALSPLFPPFTNITKFFTLAIPSPLEPISFISTSYSSPTFTGFGSSILLKFLLLNLRISTPFLLVFI